MIRRASDFGPVIHARRGCTIVRNESMFRCCSSPHCASNCAVVRLFHHDTRGWCGDHWPSYIPDEYSVLIPDELSILARRGAP